MSHFGHNLRVLRQRKRLTQVQLGRLAGVSDGIVCMYERARAPATPSTGSAIALALGVILETLTGPRLPPV